MGLRKDLTEEEKKRYAELMAELYEYTGLTEADVEKILEDAGKEIESEKK